MAEKYHIREDETLGVCKAKPGKCPIRKTDLGEPYHGTYEEVEAEIQRRFQEIYGPLSFSVASSKIKYHMTDEGIRYCNHPLGDCNGT